MCESQAERRFFFELIKYPAMMEIGVREDSINTTADRSQLQHG